MADSSNGSEETFILRKRHRYERGFTITDNLLLQDTEHLSLRAIGAGAHLWSLPDGVPTSATALAKKCKEGRDAIRAALNELAAAGYLKRERRSQGRGRWVHEVTMSDQPVFRKSAGQFMDGLSGPENPTVGKPGDKNVKDQGKDASSYEDGGKATDGRSDTIVGKAIEALGFAPVERGAFAKIITEAEKNGVAEEIILKAVRHWGDGAEPVSWLTGHIGQLDREHRARARRSTNGGKRVEHDRKHDPACWCYDSQKAPAPPGGVLAHLSGAERIGAMPQDREESGVTPE